MNRIRTFLFVTLGICGSLPIAANASVIRARFDAETQRKQLREGLAKLLGCTAEVHMHEPMTVQGDLDRIHTWVRIAKDEAGRVWSA